MFQNIPDELKKYPQWVVWRYEETEGGKPTKVPYSPSGHKHADVNKPETWGTFERAIYALEHNDLYAGIGFVLTYSDPFAFIDLDDPYERKENGEFRHSNPDEVMQRQIKIYNEFESYAERSPSGNGMHIIVKGNVESGRKRSSIEVYSGQRFMTMTGNVYRNAPIVEHHDLLNALWDQMGNGGNAASYYAGLDHARLTDEQVLDMAGRASNGQKFYDLYYNGDWQKYNYPSQSEADLALIDIIAFYSENRYQVQNLFLSSKLGQREKSRAQYRLNYMLAKCFDKMLPPVDVEGLRDKIQAAIDRRNAEAAELHRNRVAAIEQGEVKLEPARNIYSVPPGLVGDIAKFIYAQAPRPVPEIALAGAIGLVAGIVGRAYNVSGTGLNQYVLLLAGTGTGKEAIASGIDKLMSQVIKAVPAAKEFQGPGEIASPQALIKYLARDSKSFVSLIGEFGIALSQMSAVNAPPHLVGLRRMYLDLFNKSGEGKMLQPTIYSDKEKNTAVIHAPSVTLMGESTPERFYGALNEEMISEGLLPRFTVIEYRGQRPDLNEDHDKVQPRFELVERLSELCAYALTLNSSHRAIHVQFYKDAKKIAKQYDKFCDVEHRKSERDVKQSLWSRAHVKALKLAAVIAVGCNPYEPTIDTHIMQWAIDIVNADVRNLLDRFDAGEVGVDSNEQKQVSEIARVIKAFVTSEWDQVKSYVNGWKKLHDDKIVPMSYISRRLLATTSFKNDRQGASKAIERALKVLIDRGDLQEVSKAVLFKDYNVTAKCYAVSSLEVLNV